MLSNWHFIIVSVVMCQSILEQGFGDKVLSNI